MYPSQRAFTASHTVRESAGGRDIINDDMPTSSRGIPAHIVARLVLAIMLVCSLSTAFGQPSDRVWILPIDTEITPATIQYVQSRIDRANDARPLAVLFLIDTPGGQVSAMDEIVDIILNDTRIPTIGVVRNAFSAGALIAMSTEQLAMLPGSSIGAALPVSVGPTGTSAVGEKLNSALRGQFRSVAEARGRNAEVAAAMVDPRIEIPGLATSEELVTLTADQAVEYDIANVVASSIPNALDQFGYGGAETVVLERNLRERLGTWLASPIIAALLLVVGIGGILIEIFTPGFGIPGAIGIVALAVLLASAAIATPAGIWDLMLILGGILLFAAEVFLIPGFGVAGILGLAAIGFAVVRVFQAEAVIVLGWSALFGGVLLGVLIWMLPRSRFASVLRLSTRLTNEPTLPDTGTGGMAPPSRRERGEIGVALSDLRPAGIARFDGNRVDVVTEGDFVDSGSTLEVLRVEGNRVVVRRVEPEDEPEIDAPPPETPE